MPEDGIELDRSQFCENCESLSAEVERLKVRLKEDSEASEHIYKISVGVIRDLRAHLEIVLPMAAGYAREHPVGRNQEMVDGAREALEGGGDE